MRTGVGGRNTMRTGTGKGFASGRFVTLKLLILTEHAGFLKGLEWLA